MNLKKKYLKEIPSEEDNEDTYELFYKVGQPYAVTINPGIQEGDKRSTNPTRLYAVVREFKRLWETDFIDYPTPSYWFIPEYSEPTDTRIPRIHFHGILLFKRPEEVIGFLDQFYYTIIDRINNVCIKKLEDPVKWYNYCIKQCVYTRVKPIFNDMKLLPHLGLPEQSLRYVSEDFVITESSTPTAPAPEGRGEK